MILGCLFCGGYFNKGELNLNLLESHQKICTEENLYTNDPNTDGYDDF